MNWPREFEVTSPWTLKLATLNLVINGMESIIGEWGCNGLRAVIDAYGVTICYEWCDGTPDQGFELDEAKEHGLIREYSIKRCTRGTPLSELYTLASSLFIRESSLMLSTYALRTRVEGTEFMLVVLQNGRAAILMGERNKVVIPQIKASVSAHTHPRGCTPSPHDIKSLVNLLFDGGLGAGIVSTDCSLYIVREGPFTENDLISLNHLRDDLSAKDVDMVREVFKRGTIGDNLRIHIV